MEDKAAKKARRAALKEEAEKLGISYDELKKQTKSNKKREAQQLQDPAHQTEMKRMRTWSKDFDNDSNKKRRTRSMDEKEKPPAPSPEAWRNEHSIKIQGHGENRHELDFAKPFLKFTDTPYCGAIQKMFQQAGYEAPTPIQSQVRTCVCMLLLLCVWSVVSSCCCTLLASFCHKHLLSLALAPYLSFRLGRLPFKEKT